MLCSSKRTLTSSKIWEHLATSQYTTAVHTGAAAVPKEDGRLTSAAPFEKFRALSNFFIGKRLRVPPFLFPQIPFCHHYTQSGSNNPAPHSARRSNWRAPRFTSFVCSFGLAILHKAAAEGDNKSFSHSCGSTEPKSPYSDARSRKRERLFIQFYNCRALSGILH